MTYQTYGNAKLAAKALTKEEKGMLKKIAQLKVQKPSLPASEREFYEAVLRL